MSNDIIPRRFGLKFDPPAIILEYKVISKKKLYLHIMPMPELEPDHDPFEWLDILKKDHKTFLNPKMIDENQVLELIQRLQSNLLGGSENFSQDEEDEGSQEDEDWGF